MEYLYVIIDKLVLSSKAINSLQNRYPRSLQLMVQRCKRQYKQKERVLRGYNA